MSKRCRFQYIPSSKSGTVEDAFPGGKGIMKGLTIESDNDLNG